TVIMIEGHCDSRGTNEYNLALGERRATATRDYLVSLGVPVARINIVSKGEEQPFCTEETEACWQQNRRGHFIITAKQLTVRGAGRAGTRPRHFLDNRACGRGWVRCGCNRSTHNQIRAACADGVCR